MTVTVVCDVLGAENNGTTIAAMNLIRSLRDKGHEVRVVCPDAGKRGEPGFFVVPTYNLGPLNSYVDKNGVVLAKADTDVLKAAIDGADAVHVMIPFALGVAAGRLAKERSIALTAGFHCQAENLTNHLFMMNLGLANKVTYRTFYNLLYKYCDAIHYPTQFICDVFEEQVGPTPHHVISNGVSEDFTPGEGASRQDGRFGVLFTGRYSREKSHQVLIDAVAKSEFRDRIQLTFAGAGPQAENIRALADKRGILPPVMRFFSRQELIDVIRSADLYVHPAEIEIEAIACLEAIACGRVPVVSDSRRSATRFFALSDKNLFACNDSDDLARKIDYWLSHPEEREECGREYSGYAAQFSFSKCMDEMEKMLLDAVRGARV